MLCLQCNILENIQTFDKSIIADSIIDYRQWQFGYLPLLFELELKRMNFLYKMSLIDSPASLMLMLVAKDELTLLCTKYGIKNENGFTKRKQTIWDAFYLSLNF